MKLGNNSVLPGYRNKAGVAFNGQMCARFIGQEMAIEAAKELWDIWQEAKKHLCFFPIDAARFCAKGRIFQKTPAFHRTIGSPVGSAPKLYVYIDKHETQFPK